MGEFSFSSAEDSSSNTTCNECSEQDTSNETRNSSTHCSGYIYTAIVCKEEYALIHIYVETYDIDLSG